MTFLDVWVVLTGFNQNSDTSTDAFRCFKSKKFICQIGIFQHTGLHIKAQFYVLPSFRQAYVLPN